MAGRWQFSVGLEERIIADINNPHRCRTVDLPASVTATLTPNLPVDRCRARSNRAQVHVLVSQRTSVQGYRIITPFVLEDGRRIMVDRVSRWPAPRRRALRWPATITGNRNGRGNRMLHARGRPEEGNICVPAMCQPWPKTLGTASLCCWSHAAAPRRSGGSARWPV